MAKYKIKGTRYLRKYTAPARTPVYAAAIDAQRVVDSLCDIPWERSSEISAQMAYHTDEKVDGETSGYDLNVRIRERLDAALFCADHSAGLHRAYANAACYVFKLPEMASYPRLSALKVRVTSDPYNSAGARIALHTNATGEIPMNCTIARTGAAHAEGVAPRTERIVGDQNYWYPTSIDCTIEPSGGLQLQRYILVVVALESYSTVRGNWMEGCSYIEPAVEIVTDGEITGWTDGSTADAIDETTFNVARDGVYQSPVGAVSGVYGVEVMRNGDLLDALPYSLVHSSGDASVVSFVGGNSNIFTSGSAYNVTFGAYVYSHQDGDDPRWVSRVLAWADGDVFNSGSYSWNGARVLRAMDFENGTFMSVDLSSITDADVQAGIAFAWVEKLSSVGSNARVHCITKGGVELVNDVNISSGIAWSSYNGSMTDPGVHTRTEGVQIPVCLCGGSPVYLYGTRLRGNGLPRSIGYVGTVSSVRSVVVPGVGTSDYVERLIVSGDLVSVDGVPVRNCAIITLSGGVATTSRPSWDTAITPDSYDAFCVSAVVPSVNGSGLVNDPGTYIVSGGYSSLNGVSLAGCAVVGTDGTLAQVDLAVRGGTGHYVSSVVALDGGLFFYQAAPTVAERIYNRAQITKAVNVTDEQSCIGLRALYARFYGGLAREMPLSVVGSVRNGSGFVVSTATRDVKAGDARNSASSFSVPVYRLSMASIAVPFSVPIAFAAKKIRLDWASWNGTATGGVCRVWLRRGQYVTELPGGLLRNADVYVGHVESVDGWEYVGEIDATLAGASRAKTIELADALSDRLATLLFTAFVDMDHVNPSASMVLPQGVATEFAVDSAANSVSGSARLLAPDITLIG